MDEQSVHSKACGHAVTFGMATNMTSQLDVGAEEGATDSPCLFVLQPMVEADMVQSCYVTNMEEEERNVTVQVTFSWDHDEVVGPDYTSKYAQYGIYVNSSSEALVVIRERLVEARSRLARLFNLAFNVPGVSSNAKMEFRFHFLPELNAEIALYEGWIKDLTQDGDVENNPGPGRDSNGNKPKKVWKPRGGAVTRSGRDHAAIAKQLKDSVDEIKGSLDAMRELGKKPVDKPEPKVEIERFHLDYTSRTRLINKMGFDLHDFNMGLGLTLVHKVLLLSWTLCTIGYLYNQDLLSRSIAVLMAPLFVLSHIHAHYFCLWMILLSGCVMAIYFSVRKYLILTRESHSVVEKWRVVEAIKLDDHPENENVRADGISLGEIKHFDPQFVTITSETFDYTWGFFRKTTQIVSLELLAQIIVPSNYLLTVEEDIIFEKMQQTVKTLNSVNYSRFLAVGGDNVAQWTLLMAFAMYKKMKEDMRHQNFPRGGTRVP
jgi:hypothetical protein